MNSIQAITDFIFIDDELSKVDIIFIPGGSFPELGELAAEVWKSGYARHVLPSGGVSIKTGKFNGVKSKQDIYNLDYATDWDFLRDVLIKNGVDDDVILREDKSAYTKDNAFKSKKVLDDLDMKVNKAIICCKSFHARRALISYQLAFPGVEFLVHPYPYVENGIAITKDTWFKTQVGMKRVLGELMRCGNQFNDEFYSLADLL